MSRVKSVLTSIGLFVARIAIDYIEKRKNKPAP